MKCCNYYSSATSYGMFRDAWTPRLKEFKMFSECSGWYVGGSIYTEFESGLLNDFTVITISVFVLDFVFLS